MRRQEYVVGFMLDVCRNVVLIRKNRPEWQAGRLNGVGGKIEVGETPREAMVREFHEEAGLDTTTGYPWEHFVTLSYPGGKIYFYRLWVDPSYLGQAETMTDEQIEIWKLDNVIDRRNQRVTPNLRWLLPLAFHTHDVYEPIEVSEAVPTTTP